MCSTSWTSRGQPNLKAVSKFFIKASSAKEVLTIFFSWYRERINSRAYPEGSIIKGYLWYLDKMIAFSVHKSSLGK